MFDPRYGARSACGASNHAVTAGASLASAQIGGMDMGEANDADDIPTGGEAAATAAEQSKKKRRKQKVRSAWISFVGRIVAQVVGAVATIALGVLFIQKYSYPDRAPNMSAAGVGQTVAPQRAQRSSDGMALAVLPLQNFSGDPQQDYLADGMTEALITDLAQLEGLHVISRTSSMHYKDQRRPLVGIAQELGVDLILEGSIAKSGERIRVTAQLIDARTDEHLWARSYDRPLGDVLSVQAEIATEVSREVHVALTSLPSRSVLAQRRVS
jgi:TolB-like protein